MHTKAPRVVIVTRDTELELLLQRHGTRAQAEFFLATRGQKIERAQHSHDRFHEALQAVVAQIPNTYRKSRVRRQDLDRFLFEPEDTVVIVGQDGLVANVAKYLSGQWVIGINPDPKAYDGVLVPHPPTAVADLLPAAAFRRGRVEARAMALATLPDGQRLQALNEVFIGARTHQSARYRIRFGGVEERQSSSGVIITTGTGATGWACSINRERSLALTLPKPADPTLAFFVREAFPSVATGVSLTAALMPQGTTLEVTSEMNEHGVLFGDGIETDRLPLDWGVTATIALAPSCLQLVL